jgi:hypothetical protein
VLYRNFFICLFALQSMVKCNYSASTESTREVKEDRLVVRNDYDKNGEIHKKRGNL